jgi:hypothetical protein
LINGPERSVRRPAYGLIDRNLNAGSIRHPAARALNPSNQKQDKHHDDDQGEAAGGVVTPVPAVRPSRQSADQEKHKYDQNNGAKHDSTPEIRPQRGKNERLIHANDSPLAPMLFTGAAQWGPSDSAQTVAAIHGRG